MKRSGRKKERVGGIGERKEDKGMRVNRRKMSEMKQMDRKEEIKRERE